MELYKERLTDSGWHYQELLGQLMTNALPAAEPVAPRPKRRWWAFRRATTKTEAGQRTLTGKSRGIDLRSLHQGPTHGKPKEFALPECDL